AVMAVAGDAGLVVHQGVAGARQCIEECRLADVRAAHEGDQGKHAIGTLGLRVGNARPRAVRLPGAATVRQLRGDQSMRHALRSPSTSWTTRMPTATAGRPANADRLARSRAANSPSDRRSQWR